MKHGGEGGGVGGATSSRAKSASTSQQPRRFVAGRLNACYSNMDLMFANMVSSGLCATIHQPQTHLCNLAGNLSEERWAAESPPHCLAGPDEISKHAAARASAKLSELQSREGW